MPSNKSHSKVICRLSKVIKSKKKLEKVNFFTSPYLVARATWALLGRSYRPTSPSSQSLNMDDVCSLVM